MGWILDLFKGLNLAPELVTKLNDIEAELSVLQSGNVALKLEVENLQKQVADKEREKQELQQENQDLRRTKELTHAIPPKEPVKREKVENDVNGEVTDYETNKGIEGATITIQDTATKNEYQIYSDKEGYFNLSLPLGLYRVTISADGYRSVIGPCIISKEAGYYIEYGRLMKAPPTIQIA